MSDPIITTDPPTGNPSPTNNDGLSSDEVRSLIGEVLDSKLKEHNTDYATKKDMDSLRTHILSDLESKIPSLIPKGNTINEKNLLDQVGTLIDTKISGLKLGNERQPGKLGRWLLGA